MKKQYTKVDEKYFVRAKKMLEVMDKNDVIDVLGGSVPTLYRISRCKDYAEYKELAAEAGKPKQEITQSDVAPVSSGLDNAELLSLRTKVNELVAVNKTLTSNVEELLEAYRWVLEHAQIDTSKRKSWFK